jgi:hypothetical protein
MATRYVGNCQICEGDFKLHEGRMVHHGYERPGHGYIVGDCSGVREVPYEVSCELIKSYKAGLEVLLTEKKAALADLEAGKVTQISTSRQNYNGQIETKIFIAGVTALYTWLDAVQSRAYDLKSTIRQITADIERMTKRIADWLPKPVRTVEEELEKEQAAKAARKAERDAARKVRDDKKAATAAKQEALKAKRAELVEGLRTEFRTLAGQEKSPDRDLAVHNLCDKMRSKKFSWMWAFELGIIETLVQLDLAEKTEDGRIA